MDPMNARSKKKRIGREEEEEKRIREDVNVVFMISSTTNKKNSIQYATLYLPLSLYVHSYTITNVQLIQVNIRSGKYSLPPSFLLLLLRLSFI